MIPCITKCSYLSTPFYLQQLISMSRCSVSRPLTSAILSILYHVTSLWYTAVVLYHGDLQVLDLQNWVFHILKYVIVGVEVVDQQKSHQKLGGCWVGQPTSSPVPHTTVLLQLAYPMPQPAMGKISFPTLVFSRPSLLCYPGEVHDLFFQVCSLSIPGPAILLK